MRRSILSLLPLRRITVAGWLVSLTLTALLLHGLSALVGMLAWSSAAGSLGLVLDIIGAAILVHGLLSQDMASTRQYVSRGGTIDSRRWIDRVPTRFALKFGSLKWETTDELIPDRLRGTFWGIAVLSLGFACQLAGLWLARWGC